MKRKTAAKRHTNGQFRSPKTPDPTPTLPGITSGRRPTPHNVETFKSGATRSVLKRRWSLVPVEALAYLADRFSIGAPIHGAHNWKNGMPIEKVVDHIQEHWHKFISHTPDIHDDRPIAHLAAMGWGVVVLLYYAHHQSAYSDLWTDWWSGQDMLPKL